MTRAGCNEKGMVFAVNVTDRDAGIVANSEEIYGKISIFVPEEILEYKKIRILENSTHSILEYCNTGIMES